MGTYEAISQVLQARGHSLVDTASGLTAIGVCPFHTPEESTLTVSKQKDLWHCYGCGNGGGLDVFQSKLNICSMLEQNN